MQESGRPTIKDVARAAGVSPTTVSHALNGKGVVRRETVERIERIASEVGYRPSAIARGLQKSRLSLLALVIRPFNTLDTYLPTGVDYFLRLAGAASLAAMERGYSLMLVDDPTKPGTPLSARVADAYIVTEPFENDPVLTYLAEERVPFVTVGADPARRDAFPAIDADSQDQTALVLDHLVDAGAERIGFVIGTDKNSWTADSHEYYASWCAEQGREPLIYTAPESLGERVGPGALDFFFGEAGGQGPGSGRPVPDAIYCLTGRHAAGVNAEAARRGIRVPDQLLIAAASGALQNMTSRPSVTVLDLHPEELAKHAVDVAVALAEHRPIADVDRTVLPSLIVRESTTRG